MKLRMPLLLLALAGCVSVGDLRAKPAMYEGTSAKPVNEVSGCVAAALQNGFGVLVNTVPLPDGVSIIQSAHAPQGITPFVIADVRTVGSGTTMAIRANGRTPKDPSKNFSTLIACL
jgi:hypothetical protein